MGHVTKCHGLYTLDCDEEFEIEEITEDDGNDDAE